MKKLLFAIILATTTSTIQAQNGDLSSSKKNVLKQTADVQESSAASVPVNEINVKAAKDFARSCIHAENVSWINDPKGSLVYYSENEKKGQRFYDKKGRFVYDILCYSEDGLPAAIRERVKQVYYLDFKITLVQEIETEGKKIFLVQIKDATTWKQVRICNDEMEVIDQLTLSK